MDLATPTEEVSANARDNASRLPRGFPSEFRLEPRSAPRGTTCRRIASTSFAEGFRNIDEFNFALVGMQTASNIPHLCCLLGPGGVRVEMVGRASLSMRHTQSNLSHHDLPSVNALSEQHNRGNTLLHNRLCR